MLLALTACSRAESPSDSSASSPGTASVTPEASPTATQSPIGQATTDPTASPTTNPSISSTAPSASPQQATLTAKDSGSQINVRERASTNSEVRSYGQAGDAVQVMSKTQGDDGQTWYQVKFTKSGTMGWVRGDFVSLSSSPTTEIAPTATPTVQATTSPTTSP